MSLTTHMLRPVLQSVFPVGTTIGVYSAPDAKLDQAPSGTQVTSAVMGATGAILYDLVPLANYVLYAVVDGRHRYVRFRPDPWDPWEPEEFHPRLYGAAGDGVQDDSEPINACLTAAVAAAYARKHRVVVSLRGGKYKITTTINVDTHFIELRGEGAVIDATEITGVANAMIFAGSPDQVEGMKTWTNSVNRSGGFELIGPGMATGGVVGIYMDTASSVTYGPARMTLSNVVVHEFSTGVRWGDNAYVTDFQNVSVWNCNIGAEMPFNVQNAGENLHWYGGAIFGCKYGILNSNASCDMMFFGTSVDYPTWDAALTSGVAGSVTNPLSRLAQAFSGRISFFGCHFEANHDTDYWFCTGDATARILLSGCEIYLSGNKNAYELFYASQGATFQDRAQHAGVVLRDTHIKMRSDKTYNLGALVGGPGRVQANGLTWEFGLPEWLPPVARCLGAFDGTFETALAINDWTLTSSTAGAEPTISSTAAFEGSKSLRIKAAVDGDNSRAYAACPVRPGELVLASFRTLISGVSASSKFLKLTVQQLNAAGQVISTVTYGASSGSDLWNDTAGAWTLRKIYPLQVIRSAQSVQFLFEGNAWPAAALGYIDDLVINRV